MENYSEVLSEEFLLELYSSVFNNDEVAGIVSNHMEEEYLPDRPFQMLQKGIRTYVRTNKKCPTFGAMRQHFTGKERVLDLIADIEETNYSGTTDALVYALERYIKDVRLQKALMEAASMFNAGEPKKAGVLMTSHVEWDKKFSLFESGFVDILGTFRERYEQNKRDLELKQSEKRKDVNRFYIDSIDVENAGRDLRTQHSCILAPSGVGKSTAAIFIGSQCAMVGGLNVLHFSLEMSKKEVESAYSGVVIGKNAWQYRSGKFTDAQMDEYEAQIKQSSGKIFVKSYSRFANRVTTIDVKNGISDYVKKNGERPDVVIVDSMDLLAGSSGRKYSGDNMRHERVEVANDLKDIAMEENVWMLSTYQSTIEDRKLLNDETFVLSEYNLSEAKGIVRPLTHLLTLNQTYNENQVGSMRIHIAKSRFFKKGTTHKIVTDYNNGVFYDRARTMTQIR